VMPMKVGTTRLSRVKMKRSMVLPMFLAGVRGIVARRRVVWIYCNVEL